MLVLLVLVGLNHALSFGSCWSESCLFFWFIGLNHACSFGSCWSESCLFFWFLLV